MTGAPSSSGRVAPSEVDLGTQIGSVELEAPVMTAAGTAGHGAELGAYLDLRRLGAVVVKSLAPFPWAGNPAPRLHPTTAGMLNSVGLQGPGVERWIEDDLPGLRRSGARVVASIWGRTVEDFGLAAEQLAAAPTGSITAVEVNVSCPNLEDRNRIFAHDPVSTREVLRVTAAVRVPRWAKLSPNTDRIVEVAEAAVEGGAEALTLANTVLGMAIDVETRRPVLGAGRGGLSGAAIRPVAVRAVYDVHHALPTVPLIGVGGVSHGVDAVEFLLAGASAVQVGTATFADPRAAARVLDELAVWCADHGVAAVRDLVGAAHHG